MIELAIFDMDGTVFESRLDWLKIRKELAIQPGESILAEIYKNHRVDQRRLEILENYEKKNTLEALPINGIADFLTLLQREEVTTVLLTNNNRENTTYLLEKFNLDFDMIITRELKLWKPDPAAFYYIMNKFRCNSGETISIGDSHYDVKASQGAKIANIFIIKTPRSLEMKSPGIILFEDYHDLEGILKERGLFT